MKKIFIILLGISFIILSVGDTIILPIFVRKYPMFESSFGELFSLIFLGIPYFILGILIIKNNSSINGIFILIGIIDIIVCGCIIIYSHNAKFCTWMPVLVNAITFGLFLGCKD